MVALIGSRGLFHVSQELVHFRKAQMPICSDRSVTGHGGQEGIALGLDPIGDPLLGKLPKGIAHQRLEGDVCQKAWNPTKGKVIARQWRENQTECLKCLGLPCGDL